MERYPDSIRNAVHNLMGSGVTVEELEEQFGIGHGTVYKWLYKLRAAGEDVSFIKSSDRVREKVFVRFRAGASLETVFEEFNLSRATLYRMRNEYEAQDPDAPSPRSGKETTAAGKDAPTGVVRRKLADPPKDLLIKQLKMALAEKTIEVDFFRGALREVEARRRQNTEPGEKPSTGGSSK